MNADSTTNTTRKDSHAEPTPPLNAAVPLLAIAGIVGLVLLFTTTPNAPPAATTVVPGAATPQAGADPLPNWLCRCSGKRRH